MHKPQPEIYRLGAERAGLAPEECVFVDDLRENCEGAEAVGMTRGAAPRRRHDDSAAGGAAGGGAQCLVVSAQAPRNPPHSRSAS